MVFCDDLGLLGIQLLGGDWMTEGTSALFALVVFYCVSVFLVAGVSIVVG